MSQRSNIWDVLLDLSQVKTTMHICYEFLEEIEENLALVEAVEVIERQYRHQQQLDGGDVEDADNRPGRIRFLLEPVVDRRSAIVGVHERVFCTRVRQEGRSIERQSLTRALVQLRIALEPRTTSEPRKYC